MPRSATNTSTVNTSVWPCCASDGFEAGSSQLSTRVVRRVVRLSEKIVTPRMLTRAG